MARAWLCKEYGYLPDQVDDMLPSHRDELLMFVSWYNADPDKRGLCPLDCGYTAEALPALVLAPGDEGYDSAYKSPGLDPIPDELIPVEWPGTVAVRSIAEAKRHAALRAAWIRKYGSPPDG